MLLFGFFVASVGCKFSFSLNAFKFKSLVVVVTSLVHVHVCICGESGERRGLDKVFLMVFLVGFFGFWFFS